jgi:uncharacterized protein
MSFREALADYIEEQAKPREKFGHQPRLYALTRQIGEGMTYDDDVVYAAVWLHDLGVFTGHRPEDPEQLKRWDNTKYAVEQSPAILQSVGFPAEKVAPVLEAIRTHQPAFEPATLEGTILRDADILEQLGAIGVLRTVCKVGRDTRFLDFTSAIKSLEAALANLPPKIRLESTRSLAKPRIEALAAFLQSTIEEAGGLELLK